MPKVKSPYSVSVFRAGEHGKGQMIHFFRYVGKWSYVRRWLEKKGERWDYANVYDRKTKTFINRIYNN